MMSRCSRREARFSVTTTFLNRQNRGLDLLSILRDDGLEQEGVETRSVGHNEGLPRGPTGPGSQNVRARNVSLDLP